MVTVNKNILLIGRTGNGKSSLANVLSGTEEFAESADSTSETRNIKDKNFEIDGVKYCVIDTIGVGDTQLDTKAVLFRLGEIAHFIEKEGLNQIFFVTNSRFTKEEIEAYKLLSSIIFDQDVFKYTTIVRTHFPEFEDENACERDRNKLRNESGELNEIFSHAKVIYVNNPPLIGRSNAILVSKELREESRKRLITYLGTIIHKNYLPTNLNELNDRIRNYMTDKEKLKEKLKEAEKTMEKMLKDHEEKIKKFQEDMDEKIKKSEAKKDKEREELKTKLDRDIEELKKEGKASEEKLAGLKKDHDEKVDKLNKEREKEINEIKVEAERKKNADDDLKVSIKNLTEKIDGLKAENEELKNKVANEVGKQIEEKVVVQRGPVGFTTSLTGGAVMGATIGSAVPVVGTTVGAVIGGIVGLFSWGRGW